MFPYKKFPGYIAAVISVTAVFLLFSCKKTDTVNIIPEQPVDFSKKIIASASGFVTDEYQSPVVGASVQYGNAFSTTDKYGHFEIRNVEVTENAGVLTVKMAGYFNSIKTLMAQAGKHCFSRIKLIPKTSAGSVEAVSGGELVLSSGLKIILPAGGIVDAASHASYTGTVYVSSSWINPVADDMNEIMPGDLRGINTNGALRSLTSFGMAAVELTGSAGQSLQIADGKKATLNFPLPASISAQAPATIPLWYFDEAKGFWIEEGTATKTGNNYTGEVKHFTFWNCDLPNPSVPVSFTITDSANNPLNYVRFEIIPLTPTSWSHISGCTDESGYITVPVTANTQYKLQLLSNGCTASLAKNFTVENTRVDLGNIAITGGIVAIISGTATTCNNTPLSNGKVLMRNGNYLEIIYPDNTGAFMYSTLVCDNTNTMSFFAEDLSSPQQGTPETKTIHAGINNIGNVKACGVSTEEYSNITINDQHYILGPFLNGFTNSAFQTVANNGAYSTAFNISLSTQKNDLFQTFGDQVSWMFSHSGLTPVVGGIQYVEVLSITPGIANPDMQAPLHLWPLVKLSPAGPGSIPVTITEYGQIGGFISGYFNGDLYTDEHINMGNLDSPYHVIYQFRVRRYY